MHKTYRRQASLFSVATLALAALVAACSPGAPKGTRGEFGSVSQKLSCAAGCSATEYCGPGNLCSPREYQWEKVTPTAAGPARSFHNMAVHQGRFILNGGFQNDRGLGDSPQASDTWQYDPASRAWSYLSDWREVYTGRESVSACTEVDKGNCYPNGRTFATLAQVGDELVLFGGGAPNGSNFKWDTWRFRPPSGGDVAWWQKSPNPNMLVWPAQAGYALTVLGNDVLVVGGFLTGNNDATLATRTVANPAYPTSVKYTPDFSVYGEVNPSDDRNDGAALPVPANVDRFFARMVSMADGTALLYGGEVVQGTTFSGKQASFSDLQRYDGASWSDTGVTNLPMRSRFAMASDGKRALIFGGIDQGGALSGKLYVTDGITAHEVTVPAQGPSARQGAVMLYLDGRFYLYGGTTNVELPEPRPAGVTTNTFVAGNSDELWQLVNYTCAADADCVEGQFCDKRNAGSSTFQRCIPLIADGQPVDVAAHCATAGFAADGVCCTSACTGACSHCDDTGTCVATAAPTHRPACPAPAGAACASYCDGASFDCVWPGMERTCAAPSCGVGAADVETHHCNGRGSCEIATVTDCEGAKCSAGLCGATGCSTSHDCAQGAACVEGRCKEMGGSWRLLDTDPMGPHRSFHAMALTSDGSFLLNGGFQSDGMPTYAHASDTWQWNEESGWRKVAAHSESGQELINPACTTTGLCHPVGRALHKMVNLNGTLYLFNGAIAYNGSGPFAWDTWKWVPPVSPAPGSYGYWIRLTDKTAPTQVGYSLQSLGDKLLFFGGAAARYSSSTLPTPAHGYRPFTQPRAMATLSESDSAWNATILSRGPAARAFAGTAMLNGKLFLHGGEDVDLENGLFPSGAARHGDSWFFDPATSQWSQANVGLPKLSRFAMASDGKRALIVGGVDESGQLSAKAYVTDGVTFAEMPLPPRLAARQGAAMLFRDGYFYLHGGSTSLELPEPTREKLGGNPPSSFPGNSGDLWEIAFAVEAQPCTADLQCNEEGKELFCNLDPNSAEFQTCRVKGRNGKVCGQGSECGSGFCVDGVCCNEACGGGVDGDCEACTAAKGAPTDGVCGPARQGILCDGADVGPCQEPAYCNGVQRACPLKPTKPAGTTCTAAVDDGNICTVDRCSATGQCVSVSGNAGAVCGLATNECTDAPVCTGASPVCPAASAKPDGTPCLDDGSVCSSDTCKAGVCEHKPANGGAVCGAAGSGVCDDVRRCDGVQIACPATGYKAAGTVCGKAANECLEAPVCSGGSSACQASAAKPDGTPCLDDGGLCSADTCKAGICDHTKPANAGAICRASTKSGPCEEDVKCDGLSATCPAGLAFKPASTVCRSSAGECDVEEHCTGSAVACPTDAFRPASVECRSKAGPCDVAEHCTGSAATCPNDGFEPATKVCLAPSCVGELHSEATCSGGDPLCPAATVTSCAPYLCAPAGGCATRCTENAQCAPMAYCDASEGAGTCVPKKLLPLGTECSAHIDCASGYCIDGLCCDTSCGSQCEACDLAGRAGICSAAVGVPRNGRPLCGGEAGDTCAGTCDGVHTTCVYPNSETACGEEATCDESGTKVYLATSCTGTGFCPTAKRQSCAPFVCEEGSCRGDCTCDEDCSGADHYCSAGLCVPRLPRGAACFGENQCAGGAPCVDGVCCENACDGSCESCSESYARGRCVAVTGLPRPGHKPCIGVGSCAGFCDGKNSDACAYPGEETRCGDASCRDGAVTFEATCDGTGTCDLVEPKSCAPYACGDDACLHSCRNDGDCSRSFVCVEGACVVPEKDPGKVTVKGSGGCSSSPGAASALWLSLIALPMAALGRRRSARAANR